MLDLLDDVVHVGMRRGRLTADDHAEEVFEALVCHGRVADHHRALFYHTLLDRRRDRVQLLTPDVVLWLAAHLGWDVPVVVH